MHSSLPDLKLPRIIYSQIVIPYSNFIPTLQLHSEKAKRKIRDFFPSSMIITVLITLFNPLKKKGGVGGRERSIILMLQREKNT